MASVQVSLLSSAVVAPLVLVERPSLAATVTADISSLNPFQRAEQRQEFIARATKAIKETLAPSDSSALLRLSLLDAGTYDAVTKTGGFSGAILSDPEALPADEDWLRTVVAKLKKAKKIIDDGDEKGAGPISWSDLLFLATRTTTQDTWTQIKLPRIKSGSEELVFKAYGNAWDVKIGRIDGSVTGPNKVPAADAPVQEIRSFLLSLGVPPGRSTGGGPFVPKPPLWERPGFILWASGSRDPSTEEARLAAGSPEFEEERKRYDYLRNPKGDLTRTTFETE